MFLSFKLRIQIHLKAEPIDTQLAVNMSTKSSGEAEALSPKPNEESEEESDVLEESPCGRWQKRREEVCVGVCSQSVMPFTFSDLI